MDNTDRNSIIECVKSAKQAKELIIKLEENPKYRNLTTELNETKKTYNVFAKHIIKLLGVDEQIYSIPNARYIELESALLECLDYYISDKGTLVFYNEEKEYEFTSFNGKLASIEYLPNKRTAYISKHESKDHLGKPVDFLRTSSVRLKLTASNDYNFYARDLFYKFNEADNLSIYGGSICELLGITYIIKDFDDKKTNGALFQLTDDINNGLIDIYGFKELLGKSLGNFKRDPIPEVDFSQEQ